MDSQFGETALQLAARNGHLEVAQLLLDTGADKDAKNNVRPDSSICSAPHLCSRTRGVSVDSQDGNTALHYAAAYGHLEVAKLLLDAGSDKDAKDNVRLDSNSQVQRDSPLLTHSNLPHWVHWGFAPPAERQDPT